MQTLARHYSSFASAVGRGCLSHGAGSLAWSQDRSSSTTIQLQRTGDTIPFASLRSTFKEEEMGEEHDFADDDLDALGQFIENVIPRCRQLELRGFVPEDLCPDSPLDLQHLESLLVNSDAWSLSPAFSSAP